MPTTEKAVLKALRSVKDPDLNKDIVTLGFVKDVNVDAHAVSFRIVLTTPACPLREKIKSDCESAVRKAIPSVREVNVTMDAEVSPNARKPLFENLLPQVKNVIAVASGKGGVGKSTVAANLAVALALQGAEVGLLDADIYGPSMGVMLGVADRPEVVGNKLIPIRAHGLYGMSIGFCMDPDTPVIWRGPMVMKAVEQFLRDVEWPELDYMVVDLPPGTGDAQLTLVQKVPISGAVIVTTPNEVSLIDARKGLAMFQKMSVPVFGIVENMSTFICPHCKAETEIFSRGGGKRTAMEMGVPFLGEIPLDPAVRDAGDAGTPVILSSPGSAVAGAFRSLASLTAQQASIAALRERR
jgi:ATP-binding protein involved in chromosome partitioning